MTRDTFRDPSEHFALSASYVEDRRSHYGAGGEALLTDEEVRDFRRLIYGFYEDHGRDFPWRRESCSPYEILVSEVMLQQTQTERVVPRFNEFIAAFPTVEALAEAELKDVLSRWQGLGYNRRGLMLHRLAGEVVSRFDGHIPGTPEELITLPGLGKATAASVAAFAFNYPSVFIETNIRTLFIYFFFPDSLEVKDGDIVPLVETTLDREHPHHWYSALMDYGVMLKKVLPNPSRKSAHHRGQSAFEGSDRQIRGRILKELLAEPGLTVASLVKVTGAESDRVKRIVQTLLGEGLIRKEGRRFFV